MKRKIFVIIIIAIFFGTSYIPLVKSINNSIDRNPLVTKEITTEKTYYNVSFYSGGGFNYIFNFFPRFILNVKIDGDHSFMILKKMLITDYDGIEIEGKDREISCTYQKEINNPYFDGYTYINEDSYFGEHTITITNFEGKITIREETGSTEIPFKNDMFIMKGKAEKVVVSKL